MTNRIIKLSAAAALVAAMPTLAAAQSVAYSTSPVSVTSCSVNEFYAPLPYLEQEHFTANDIALSYVNKSNVAATSVKVLVSGGGDTQTLVATGTFAPGVQIERTFAAHNGTSALDPTCSVAEVNFADGSAWHAAPRNVANR